MIAPLRTIAAHLPKAVRLYARRAARVVLLLLTPHRMPARLRFLSDRRRLACGTTATYAKPVDRKTLRSQQSSTKAATAPKEPSRCDASQRDLIASSSLFDADWYLKQYPDVAAAKLDPVLHYLRHGASEGRDPSALFSTRAYLDLYPSVAQSRINPLVHYLEDGQIRGLTVIEKVLRSPQSSTKAANASEELSRSDASQRDLIASSALFDADWYLEQYPDVAAAKLDPALHYLRYGASEGRDPSARFSTRAYLDLYRDVAQSRINPLVHYVKDGQLRGLTVIDSKRGMACVDRREKLLSGLNLDATTGVEIGPLDKPVVSRDDGLIIYVDHQNAEELRQRFANNPDVAVTDIIDVDAIWGSNTLQEAIGVGVGVDYVVASHVVEHVPDLISWLEELRAVLRPGGTVRLAVPDRRYTFDYLRRESSAVEVLSAYCVRARIPLPYSIIDFMVNFAQVDVTAAWSDDLSPDRLVRHHTVHDAIRAARQAHEEGAYHDVHCWVFTPRSFANLFAELAEIGLVRFSCAYFVDTAHNELEFFVGLAPSDDITQMVESWKQMARSAR
jgi:SAM-dependent methyltransferase